MMPSHAARAALVSSGAIGTPTQVQVSSTQQYHAVALIRCLLSAGRGSVSVRTTRFTAPLISPLSRTGWTDDEEAHPTTTTIATLDFGDGRSRCTTSLSSRRATSCGSVGSRCGDRRASCTTTGGPDDRPADARSQPLVRRQTGYDLDLIGYDTEHFPRRLRCCIATPILVAAGWTMRSPWPPCWSGWRVGCAVRGQSRTRWPRVRRTSSSRWPSSSPPIAIPR